jgi:hypothetical protein
MSFEFRHSNFPRYIQGMKAVSIKQPWASLIAAGVKTLEIRQWPTEHRGPLLIVSSRRPVLEGHRHGEALCIVDVVDCRRMTREDPPFACIPDFYFDHYAWVLKNVKLIEAFSVMGQLRLFDVPDKLIKLAIKAPRPLAASQAR